MINQDPRDEMPDVADASGEEIALARDLRKRLWIIALLVAIGMSAWFAEQYVARLQPTLDVWSSDREKQSIKALETDVESALTAFGIEDKWVRKDIVVLAEEDTVRYEWTVRVPRNLPIVSMANDLQLLAKKYDGKAFAIENARTGQVSVHVAFKGAVRYSLIFTPLDGIRRATGKIALLLDGLENAPGSEVDMYLAGADPIGCVLIPSREALPLYERISSAGREIVIHIHFSVLTESGSRMSFSDNLSEKEIEYKIRTVLRHFPAASRFFISSEQTPGASVRFADRKFRMNGLTGLDAAGFFYLDRTAATMNLPARMNEIAAAASKSGSLIGIAGLQSGTMELLRNEMTRLRKKGMDFVSLNSIIQNN